VVVAAIPGPLIVNPLSGGAFNGPPRLSGTPTASNTFSRKDVNYDFAIGGIPFVAGVSNTRNSYFRRRYTRDLQQISKAQFDNQQNPGEQSFTGWWLRSQASFHGGAGITYSDTGIDTSLGIRFQDSYGINPWTINQLTLLNTTNNALSSANTNLLLRSINVSGVDYLLCADGTSLRRLTGSSTSLTYTVTGMTGTISSITDDGTNYYVATTSGVYSGPLTNGSAGTLYYNTNGSANISLGWVKGRLAASQDNYVYLGLASGQTLGTGNGTFHHLNTGWVWNSFDDGPNAIYAAGHAGAQSEIWRAAVDNTGSVPTILSGTTTAVMPRGELINNIYSYLQTFMAVCTTKGVRIAAINGDGSITYGQLLWSTDSYMGSTASVQGVIGSDRFLYVGVTNVINTQSGAARIDLGTTTTGTSQNSSYAYAKDISAHTTGTTTSVAALGNSQLIAVAVSGKGVYVQDPSLLETSGSFLTSRVRYNTTEPKLFKYLTVRSPNSYAGSINIFVDDPTGAENSITTLTQNNFSSVNIGLSYPTTASEWIAIRFTFNQGSTTTGPVLNNWQIKALPGTTRQRLITVPLLVFDHTKDKMGNRTGQTGMTWQVLQQFEALSTKGDVVLFQDLNTQETEVVIINDAEFEQLAEPQQNGEGLGGFLTVSLLTIT
jgi:hypothetical protein